MTLRKGLETARDALRSYEYGNSNPLLAKQTADKLDALLSKADSEQQGMLSELQHIDEVLARRPALADCKTRIGKIELAIYTANRLGEAEASVADLWSRFAEAESDAASWERQCDAARDDALKYGNESNDLRRKLEEAAHDIVAYRGALGYSVPANVGHILLTDGTQPVCGMCGPKERELADASLSNTALMKALIWCGGSEDFGPEGKARAGWERITKPLLALPADGIVDEVVWLLSNAVVDKDETPTSQWEEWDGRRDALLARLGGAK
jgi:hypothetical protein